MLLMNVFKVFLSVTLFSQISMACNFSTDIKENSDGTFTYSRACHVQVGKTQKELSLRQEQVKELNAAILLKDSAILKYEERTLLWMETSYKLNDRLQSYERHKETNNWILIGTGFAAAILATWAAGQAVR